MSDLHLRETKGQEDFKNFSLIKTSDGKIRDENNLQD